MTDSDFEDAIAKVRSADALLYEEGYHLLQGVTLAKYLDDVIGLMRNETDPKIRGRLIEIVADSMDAKVVSVLAEELRHRDIEVRTWALWGLDRFDLPSARETAFTYRTSHPNEDL